MNIMAASRKGYSNTSSHALLDTQNEHDRHSLPVQYSPQFERQDHHLESNQMASTMLNHSTPSSSTQPPINNIFNNDFMRKYHSSDVDEAFLFLSDVPATAMDPSASFIGQDHQRSSLVAAGMRPATLNIFPSQPMHTRNPASTSTTKVTTTTTILSSSSNCSQRPLELSNDDINLKREGKNKEPSTSSLGKDYSSTPDAKTMRRLAQNREAARKSRLRKKAYVQQLESSRMKLTQLEQELQQAKNQGIFLGGIAGLVGADQGPPHRLGTISSDAMAFNMEYAKWLDGHRLRLGRLQETVENHLSENEIRFCVDNCITHIDDFMHLKSMIVKYDVFHILSGLWKTPVERCFLWIGGFRPSELIKMILAQIEPFPDLQIEPFTDQQIMRIYELQNVILEGEKVLSKEHAKVNQSLSDTIISENLKFPYHAANYMAQMSTAMNKLSNLGDIVNQADKLRLQTIHSLYQLMTTRQASRSLMAIGEYFHRIHSLSSLWGTRERKP